MDTGETIKERRLLPGERQMDIEDMESDEEEGADSEGEEEMPVDAKEESRVS